MESGLTASEYAAETGLNAHTLSWWKWRLGAGAEHTPRPRSRRARAVTTTAAPLTFVEVTPPTPTEPFELILPTSIRIRVPPAFDAATLGRLLDVLEQRR